MEIKEIIKNKKVVCSLITLCAGVVGLGMLAAPLTKAKKKALWNLKGTR